MIKTANKQKDNTGASIRRRLSAAICMLLIATVMLVTSTYAWFTLSTAPEVKGINTSIAGNGSLEIALMPSSGLLTGISSGRGVSGGTSGTEYGGDKQMTVANASWGNVVNLKDPYYGLNLITLTPIKFDYETTTRTMNQQKKDGEGNPVFEEDGITPVMEEVTYEDATGVINEKAFLAPEYGYDGRIRLLKELYLKSKDTSATFDSDNYGVRAIVDENGVNAYGYVIDLAFRLNSVASADENGSTPGKLLLQTNAIQRIYNGQNDASTADATQGGGSRLWFQTKTNEEVSGVDQDQASEYLKAIRIAFVQNFGNGDEHVDVSDARVLAYAKPDISTGYLTICKFNGDPVEAGKENVIIEEMAKNTAYQISAVVWLDGTSITNANMAINNDVLNKATLNLQFSTDVSLVPAENSIIRNDPPAPATTAAANSQEPEPGPEPDPNANAGD